MAQLRVTGGVLSVESLDAPGGPDAGHDLPSGGHPWVPGHLPEPPPGVWPPLTISLPIQPTPPGVPPGAIWPPVAPPLRPDAGLPPVPGHPDAGLPPAPARPDAGPPVAPARPGAGLPPVPGHPDAGLPPAPARPDNGLPSKTYWLIAGIPGVGWRYVAIDPSLVVGYPLPPTAEPK